MRLKPLIPLIVAAVLAGCATAAPGAANEQDSRVSPSWLLTQDRAGPFTVAMTAGELYGVVDRQRVTLVDRFAEGSFTPAVQVKVQGSDLPASVVADLDVLQCPTFRGWYFPILEVRDPRFRTGDGSGVGSTFSELVERGWITAEGAAGPQARDIDVPYFVRIRFVFEGLEGECEGCRRPADDARVVAVRLSEPFPRMRDRRCEELRR